MLTNKKHDESLNRFVYLEAINAERVFFSFGTSIFLFEDRNINSNGVNHRGKKSPQSQTCELYTGI